MIYYWADKTASICYKNRYILIREGNTYPTEGWYGLYDAMDEIIL